jgi:hypothetical protein
MVALPVRCPKCGAVGLSEFPVVVVAIALVEWNNMCLYAPCHEGGWDAGERELEAIRQHLGRDWIWEYGQSFLARASNVTFLDLGERDNLRKLPVRRISEVRRGAIRGIPARHRQARDVN